VPKREVNNEGKTGCCISAS